ncbi:MAG: hypothetical protein WKG07_45485 [Hymenobacter sp.]
MPRRPRHPARSTPRPAGADPPLRHSVAAADVSGCAGARRGAG